MSKKLTGAERHAELIAAGRDDRYPLEGQVDVPAGAKGAGPDADDVFQAEDLDSPDNSIYYGERFPMPSNGKPVWVFGMNAFDARQILTWTARDGVPEIVEAGTPTQQLRARQKLEALLVEERIFTVISQVRCGPTRDADPVWKLAQFRDLQTKLHWTVIRRICEIVDARTYSAETLSGSVSLFFGVSLTCARNLLSVCDTSTDCRRGLKEIRTRWQSLESACASPELRAIGTTLRELEEKLRADEEDTGLYREALEALLTLGNEVARQGAIDADAALRLQQLSEQLACQL